MGDIGGGTPIFHYMDVAGGHGAGDEEKNHNGDYRTEPLVVSVRPPEDVVFVLTAVTVFVGGVGKMAPDGYGNRDRLENGIVVGVRQNGDLLIDTTAGLPIRSNADWLKIGQTNQYLKAAKQTGVGYWISWWLASMAGDPVFLDGRLRHEFSMLLQDDFRELVEHYFVVFGYHRLK